MKDFAIVKAGKVINVVVLDDADQWTVAGEQAVPVQSPFGIGDSYDGIAFQRKPDDSDPPPRPQNPEIVALRAELAKLKSAIIAKTPVKQEDIDAAVVEIPVAPVKG